jgi:hypothetical protein
MEEKTMKHPHRKKHSKINLAWPWVVAFVGVVGAVAILAAGNAKFSGASAQAEDADVVVYKRSSCNCCNLWVEHLRDNGLKVSVVNVDNTQSVQKRFGVPEELAACHTAQVGEYWVEGHVPADLVLKLLKEKPENIRGLAVPGMPVGSPGMEGPNPVAYSVISLDNAGKKSVYARREGASMP